MEYTIEEKVEILIKRVLVLEKKVEKLENPIDLTSEQIEKMLDEDCAKAMKNE